MPMSRNAKWFIMLIGICEKLKKKTLFYSILPIGIIFRNIEEFTESQFSNIRQNENQNTWEPKILKFQANADRESHDSLFKQLLRNIEDVLEENHHLKESLLMLDENLAEAKNDFKMVCHRLSLIEKKTDKKCKSKCEENR